MTVMTTMLQMAGYLSMVQRPSSHFRAISTLVFRAAQSHSVTAAPTSRAPAQGRVTPTGRGIAPASRPSTASDQWRHALDTAGDAAQEPGQLPATAPRNLAAATPRRASRWRRAGRQPPAQAASVRTLAAGLRPARVCRRTIRGGGEQHRTFRWWRDRDWGSIRNAILGPNQSRSPSRPKQRPKPPPHTIARTAMVAARRS